MILPIGFALSFWSKSVLWMGYRAPKWPPPRKKLVRLRLISKSYRRGVSLSFWGPFFAVARTGFTRASDPLVFCGLRVWCRLKFSMWIPNGESYYGSPPPLLVKNSLRGESYYGSPPNFSLKKIGGFKTSSRSYLLKYGVTRHPPRRHRSIGLCTQENVWILRFKLYPSLGRAAMKRSLKKIDGLGGRIS